MMTSSICRDLSRFRRAVFLLGYVAGLIVAVGCGRADTPPTAERVRELVERLASPRKTPLLKEHEDTLPKGVGYSEISDERSRVIPIYAELSDAIEVALPILIEHADDERFSHVAEDGSSGCYYSRSVGTTCTELIERHVEVYQPYTLGNTLRGMQ